MNPRRVSRALQKIRAGLPLLLLRDAEAKNDDNLPYDFRGVFLTQPRVDLLPLLDYRCEKIVQAGLIEVPVLLPTIARSLTWISRKRLS